MAKSSFVAGAEPTGEEIVRLRSECRALRERQRELEQQIADTEQHYATATAEATERADRAEQALPALEFKAATGELALRLGVPVDALTEDTDLAQVAELIAQRKRAAIEGAANAEALKARRNLAAGPPIAGELPNASTMMNQFIRQQQNGRGGP
jgi:hypothetical protein